MKYLKRTIDDVEKIYYQLSLIIIYNNRTGNLCDHPEVNAKKF